MASTTNTTANRVQIGQEIKTKNSDTIKYTTVSLAKESAYLKAHPNSYVVSDPLTTALGQVSQLTADNDTLSSAFAALQGNVLTGSVASGGASGGDTPAAPAPGSPGAKAAEAQDSQAPSKTWLYVGIGVAVVAVVWLLSRK